MQILALDFGRKKIGVAWADSKIGVALAQASLLNDQNFWPQLKVICRRQQISKIIVGYPQGLQTETAQTRKVQKFVQRLRTELNLPVQLCNEVFSSKIAAQNLQQSKNLDSEAARIILQDSLSLVVGYWLLVIGRWLLVVG